MKDLFILTADRQQEYTISTLLKYRTESLQIRQISFFCIHHPQKDSGVFHSSAELIKSYQSEYKKAIIFIDKEWSNSYTKDMIKNQIIENTERSGWNREDFEVIVFDPELEIWFWIKNSPHVSKILESTWENILNIATSSNYWDINNEKPSRPKELLEKILLLNRIPRSASIYEELAKNASFRRCEDPSFHEFLDVLRRWFPKT